MQYYTGLSAAVKFAEDASIVSELERRVRAERHMAAMPDKERRLAEEAEQTRRSQWNDGNSATSGKPEVSSGADPRLARDHDSYSVGSDASLQELAKRKTLWAATMKEDRESDCHDDDFDPGVHMEH